MHRGIRSIQLAVAVALLAGCVDSGPPSQQQIDQDIRADSWTRSESQQPPLLPGAPPPDRTGDDSARAIP